jgi:hypothetical protein
MDIKRATEQARQILDEERAAPTVQYVPSAPQGTDDLTKGIVALAASLNLHQLRQQHPRNVIEDARMFTFKSKNFDLLRALHSQIGANDRPRFILYCGLGLVWGVGAAKNTNAAYPKWNLLTSELPLVAEFLIRNGGKNHLFATLEDDKTKIIPGHVLLTLQLEEVISFNYTQFTDAEYKRLSLAVDSFGKRAHDEAESYRKRNVHEVRWPDIGSVSAAGVGYAIEKSCSGIKEQCRKARYFYIKGALEENSNLEINQDKTAVDSYLHRLGFDPSLIKSLDEAERLYREEGTPFDLKSSLGHLRSFLENVQKQAMPSVHAIYGEELRLDWGGGVAYLTKHGILSRAEEQLAVSLYRLISDEGVHQLISEREYVRLARNMVIEYCLLLLTKLAKLGTTNSAARLAGQV